MTLGMEATTIAQLAAQSGFSAETVASGNVLGSVTYVRQISGMHRAVLERIAVEVPAHGTYESADLYVKQKQMMPRKRLLERVAMAAGIKWVRCGIDYVDASSVVYSATGGVRGPGGEMTWVTKSKEWLLDTELIEIHERANEPTWDNSPGAARGAKRARTDEERAAYISSETARTKANRLGMVESKAQNRVMRALLGLPGAADASYWSKPLFVVRIDMVLDANDPMTKGMLLAESIGAKHLLGIGAGEEHRVEAARPAPQLAAAPDPEPEEATDVEVVEETPAALPCGTCKGLGEIPDAAGNALTCPTCQGNGEAAA